MNNIIDTNYINQNDLNLVKLFLDKSTKKKYILGVNKFTKAIQKQIQVDGIIDDFTRIQSSRKKKNIFSIEEIDKDSIILWTSSGSPLEVKNKLNSLGFKNFSYLCFYKYSNLELPPPPFIVDFKEDYINNQNKYEKVYNLLSDDKSKEVFEKVINFKISFDYTFMDGFTNNFDEQYFDKEIVPYIKNIVFLDGGGYIGDTTPNIIKNYCDYKKIHLIEPSLLHINIAKRNLSRNRDIEFINCGLGSKKSNQIEVEEEHHNCNHNFQAQNINTIDNLINNQVDFIKLDIEGAEQDAIDGAKNTIAKYKPILAICIYHKAEDWYKIPELVLSINSDYKIYIRHYMEGIYETVMYFIPK